MPQTTIQNSFNTGEISPSMFGRTDLPVWRSGASTMRNFFVNYRGGASSRAGLAYVGMCKQSGNAAPPRDINFQFNINQGYVLEFGDAYMRIKSQGAYVTESANTITGATQANPAVLDIPSHGYSAGDWIFIQGMLGMTNFNGLTWIVHSVPDANHVTLTDLFGNIINSTLFNSYISGGSAARIYTVVSPYAAADLPYLKFTQSADTMTLTCVNIDTRTEYPSYELERFGNTDWTFTADTFAASIGAPSGVAASAQSSSLLTTWYSYVVTAVSAVTAEESVASTPVAVRNNDIGINAGSNTVTWESVTGASSYNVYAAVPSYNIGVSAGVLYGFIGTALGTNFTDTNITPDFTIVPPVHLNPFARGQVTNITPTAGGANYSQPTIGYSISTSTGSGFVGTPIVANGQFTGFVIEDGGQGYLNTDTISITDSGGGVATGTFTFTTNPADKSVIDINGYQIEFVALQTGLSNQQTSIAATLALTLQALVNILNSSSIQSWSVATYTASGTVVTVTYDISGSTGNAFTLGAGTVTGCSVSGATLTGGGVDGTGARATLVVGPQSGTYPSAVAYYQQRRAYANTLNDPDTYFMSKPGAFNNMDASIPTTDADAITGSPWAQQVNGIQFMVPMPGGLVVLTGKGAWQVNGGNSAAITPSDQTANPQAYNGCSNTLPPLTINYDILYGQSEGDVVRDLSYNFFVNIYTGTDLTALSNQLFSNRKILQWAWAQEPYKIVWASRDDGVLLSLTYLKEQEVLAWARHDTNGLFKGVCVITEPGINRGAGTTALIDAPYFIVKRYVQGAWRYYSERMDDRNWRNVEDCWCVDAGLSYPQSEPNATLTPSAPQGTKNITGTKLISGGTAYTAPIVTALDPTGAGSGATFSVTVAGGVITAIAPLTSGMNYATGTQYLISDSTGSGAIAQPLITNIVPFFADAAVFSSSNVGDVIRVGGGIAQVTSFVSSEDVLANILVPITRTVPNDPNFMPVPAVAGDWTISTPTTVVSGLNHLEGLTVAILADGSVVPNQIVTNGAITLPAPASQIVVGLPFLAQLQTLYIDPPGQPTTVQSRRKNIYSVAVRMESSRGMMVGSNQPDASTQPNGATVAWSNLKPFKQRTALTGAGNAIPLFTGDEFINIPANWDEKGQIAIQQDYPLPANVLAVIAYCQYGDTPG